MQQRRKLKPRGRPFPKGSSGNPKGRPKEYGDLKALAREHTQAAIERLEFWLQSDDARASVQAAGILLDRGWGKPGLDIKLRAELLPGGLAGILREARERVAKIKHEPPLAIEHKEDCGAVALHKKEDQ